MNSYAKNLAGVVKSIKKVKGDVYLLELQSAYLAGCAEPGTFLHIKVDSVILRRPFSVHKARGRIVSVLFKVKGRGTQALAGCVPGKRLDIIGPLGKGFAYPKRSDAHSEQRNEYQNKYVLVAGGIGVAPLLYLAEKLKKTHMRKSSKDIVLLGAAGKKDILCEKAFKSLGYRVYTATEDGSRGYKGTVTDLLKQRLPQMERKQRIKLYACGPKAMFENVYSLVKKNPLIECQVSFEQFMGCGLGICCACVIETKDGYKKVCEDGPVFNIKDIW